MGNRRRIASLALGLIAVIVVGACSDDGGSSASDGSTTTEDGPTTTAPPRDEPAEGYVRLELAGVPFSFDYPADFAAVPAEQLPSGFQAILGLDQINFLDVRLTAQEELGDDELEALGDGFDTESTRVLESSSTDRPNLASVDFVVEDTSGAAPTLSRLHFFRAGGQTWEIACQSDANGRARMDAACDEVLRTIRIEN